MLVEPSPNPMPGLGPSLLREFLAEPHAGTQPGGCLADGEIMVEPVGFRVLGGRPEGVLAGPAERPISAGKHGEFASCLRRGEGPPAAVAEGDPGGAAVKFPGAQSEREMAVSREGPAGLAPDDRPGLAPGPGEPAGWLFLVSPSGGDGGAGLALNQSPAAARGAESYAAVLSERWVRRLALGGDARRAAARLEIGAGRVAGAELLVVTEPGHVSVTLNLPEPVDGALSSRLQRRLEARGYTADVTVR